MRSSLRKRTKRKEPVALKNTKSNDFSAKNNNGETI
jgi:hypothetical protein